MNGSPDTTRTGTAPTISVICPTIKGREDHYARCVAAYEQNTVNTYEFITIRDKPTCAHGWNEGAEQARGKYVHFTADDLEPHTGWDVPAVEAVEAGFLPAPRLLNANGTLDYCGVHGQELPDWFQVEMSVVPFMTREQWEVIRPVPLIHYFSDNYISWAGARAGYLTVVRRQFQFTHHWAQPGRGAGMTQNERMQHDRAIFQRIVAGIEVPS